MLYPDISSGLNSFTEKQSEATRKFANLKSELTLSEEAASRPARQSTLRRRSSIHVTLAKDKLEPKHPQPIRKMHDVKLAFSEFYLSCILLQNYQTLNFTGFRKILKKHDKVL